MNNEIPHLRFNVFAHFVNDITNRLSKCHFLLSAAYYMHKGSVSANNKLKIIIDKYK